MKSYESSRAVLYRSFPKSIVQGLLITWGKNSYGCFLSVPDVRRKIGAGSLSCAVEITRYMV